MKHDYRHLSTAFDMDAWLDATDDLIPGNHSANDVPAHRPFVHMVGPHGEMLLRQWPEGTTPQFLAGVAHTLDAIHESVGERVPVMKKSPLGADRYHANVKGRLYTAQTWLPGRALGRFGGYSDPDSNAIMIPLPETAHANSIIFDTATLVAQAHAATEQVDRSGIPNFTLAAMMQRVRSYWREHRKILGEHAAEERDIRRWLRCGNRVVPTASDLLRNNPFAMKDESIINHGHLWPENVLIEGHEDERQLTGLVGWGRIASGSPLIDIAQLTVFMQGWSAALTEGIVEAYSVTRTLPPDQRRLVPAVAGLLLVETVGEMLRLSYIDERMIGHEATSVLRSGMKTLLDSLERLTDILAPDIERTERMNERRREQAGAGAPKSGKASTAKPDSRPSRKHGSRKR